MKKILLSTVIFSLAFSLVACDNIFQDNTVQTTATTVDTSETTADKTKTTSDDSTKTTGENIVETSQNVSEEVTETTESIDLEKLNLKEFSLHFIEEAFSIHSDFSSEGLISDVTPQWMNYYTWRRDLIQKRRETFGNQKQITKIEVEYYDEKENEEMAIVLISTLEHFYYTDEKDLPGASRATYIITFEKTDESYQVLSAFDSGSLSLQAQGFLEDSYGLETRPFARIQEIFIPFIPNTSEINKFHQIDLNQYKLADVKEGIEAFQYADLENLRSLELDNIEADKKPMQENAEVLAYDSNNGLKPLDREKMKQYIDLYALSRNSEWADITPYGGDCQNFASQTIFNGGAPMAVSGDNLWFFNNMDSRSPAWTGVVFMHRFILANNGQGPQGQEVSTWQKLDYGDMVLIDWTFDGFYDHTTIVSSTGKQARISGHSRDNYQERVSDLTGVKTFIHLLGYKE